MSAREWVYTQHPIGALVREYNRLGRVVASRTSSAQVRVECREHRRDMAVGIVERLLNKPWAPLAKGGAN